MNVVGGLGLEKIKGVFAIRSNECSVFQEKISAVVPNLAILILNTRKGFHAELLERGVKRSQLEFQVV